jgi:hypothetical protein
LNLPSLSPPPDDPAIWPRRCCELGIRPLNGNFYIVTMSRFQSVDGMMKAAEAADRRGTRELPLTACSCLGCQDAVVTSLTHRRSRHGPPGSCSESSAAWLLPRAKCGIESNSISGPGPEGEQSSIAAGHWLGCGRGLKPPSSPPIRHTSSCFSDKPGRAPPTLNCSARTPALAAGPSSCCKGAMDLH